MFKFRSYQQVACVADEMEALTGAEILFFKIGSCVRGNVPACLEERSPKKKVRHFTRKILPVLNSLKTFIQRDVRCNISTYLYWKRIMKYFRSFLSPALTNLRIFCCLGPYDFVKHQSCVIKPGLILAWDKHSHKFYPLQVVNT